MASVGSAKRAQNAAKVLLATFRRFEQIKGRRLGLEPLFEASNLIISYRLGGE